MEVMMKIRKSIEEMDRQFAKESQLTYSAFKNLSLMEQSKIKRTIINKQLKKKSKSCQ
jgi:hypothetical protein